MNQLRTLDVSKRPFHCTDVKRETVYIKEAEAWNKDDKDKSKLKKVIKTVANKNIRKIKEWHQEHPDIRVLDSPDYEMNHRIIRQAMGDGKDEELQNKIIKNLVKEVHV